MTIKVKYIKQELQIPVQTISSDRWVISYFKELRNNDDIVIEDETADYDIYGVDDLTEDE